jgi:hypothetical protein
MHILVPGDDGASYDVHVEDTYDGVPPICCLESEPDAPGWAVVGSSPSPPPKGARARVKSPMFVANEEMKQSTPADPIVASSIHIYVEDSDNSSGSDWHPSVAPSSSSASATEDDSRKRKCRAEDDEWVDGCIQKVRLVKPSEKIPYERLVSL